MSVSPSQASRKPAPQAGILNRPAEHVIVAALGFAGQIPPRDTLEGLREVIRRECRSDLDNLTPATDPTVPTPDSGVLGVEDHFNRGHLTATVGISRSGYSALGFAADDIPQDLADVPWAQMGDTRTGWDGNPGDLVVQLCGDDLYVLEHFLRRIEHTLRDGLQTRWTAIGAQRYTTRSGRVSGREARALIGFHDGISNLDPAHNADDQTLVFVDPDAVPSYPATPTGQQPAPTPGQSGYGTTTAGPRFPDDLRMPPTREPEWTRGGTYMFIRVSTMDITAWDNEPLATQQNEVGRFKYSGAPLDRPDDVANLRDEPDFTATPTDQRVPLDSHLRKANPRTSPEDGLRRIFRRGYPLLAATAAGTLRRGLLFISFSRTISTQPEFILRAWMRNPDFPEPGRGNDRLLNRDTEVAGGGYYFVAGLEHSQDPGSFLVPATQIATKSLAAGDAAATSGLTPA